MDKPVIIAGFAGIGKTTLAKKYKNVIDLESSLYKWDNSSLENIPVEERKGMIREQNKDWPMNYINAIQDAVQIYDIVLVWIHPDVLKIYDEYNIPYILCYPDKKSLEIYRKRYIDRGNNKEYIDKVINTFEFRERQFESMSAKKIILHGNATLEDYLINNHFKLISN